MFPIFSFFSVNGGSGRLLREWMMGMAETDVGQTVSGPTSASASGQILGICTDVVARCGSGYCCCLRASPS